MGCRFTYSVLNSLFCTKYDYTVILGTHLVRSGMSLILCIFNNG